MPFTLSHPAAVLPLFRRPFVPVALIAGAMAPDLPYFLNIPVTAESWYEPFVNATFSHSLLGLLLVGLPSVVFLALLVSLVRSPIGDVLPVRLRVYGRDSAQQRRSLSWCFWFVISALIGMATHIIWDSLTGAGSWAATHMPVLQLDLATGQTLDRFIQHASTVIGAILIVVWCVRRFRSRQVTIERLTISRRWILQRVAIMLPIAVVSAVFAVLAVKQVYDREGAIGIELALSLFVTSGTLIATITLLIYALTWHMICLFKRLTSHTSPV